MKSPYAKRPIMPNHRKLMEKKVNRRFAILFHKTVWVFDFLTNKPVGFREHNGNIELTISALEFAEGLGAFFWRLPHAGETEPVIDGGITSNKTGLQS